MSMFTVAREKTKSFELELANSLQKLDEAEKKIKNLVIHRRDWLNYGSAVEELEAELLRKRIEFIRDKRELLNVDNQLNQIQTEAVYETQVLKVLVAATKPLGKTEQKKDRDAIVGSMTQESSQAIHEAVKRSIAHHNITIDNLDEMAQNIDIFFIDQQQRQHARIEMLNAKFDAYKTGLKTLVSTAEDKLKKVTGEYLILRHNARIAREVLMQNKKKLKEDKEFLVERAGRMRSDVEYQLETAESKLEGEMDLVVSKRRSEVLKAEEQLEHDWAELEEARNFHTHDGKNLRKNVSNLKMKLNRLKTQRVKDVSSIEKELKYLRLAVREAEQRQLVLPPDMGGLIDAIGDNRNGATGVTYSDLSLLNERLLSLKMSLKHNFVC